MACGTGSCHGCVGRHRARQAARLQRRARSSRSTRYGRDGRRSTPDQVDLRVRLGDVELAHPLLNASGTFDLLEYARRYEGDYFAAFPYAAYVPKTVTADARTGNPPPRVTETPSGMINAIGLENPGVAAWIAGLGEWARLAAARASSASGGNSPEQYAAVVRAWRSTSRRRPSGTCPDIGGYELNVSCPNVASGLQIGADPAATAAVVGAVRPLTTRLLLAKLTPNVSDVVDGRPRRRRGRRRRPLAGQHVQGDGARPGHAPAVPRQPHRRSLRTGDQADRPAHGRRGRDGAAGRADRRHGRRDERPRRARVHRLRRHGRGRGRGQLHRPSRRRAASSTSCAPSWPRAACARRPTRAASPCGA